jgi:ATP-dependent RNA/DNA helicase IGHMBP2
MLLHLDALPPRLTKGALLRFICEQAGVDSQRIGTIVLNGRQATLEVPDGWAMRMARALDGARLGETNIRARCDVAAAATPLKSTGDEDHFARLSRLLRIESAAAAEQTRLAAARNTGAAAERTGECLVNLVILDESTSLGGRALVTLGKRDRTTRLPWTRLGAGSPVVLSEEAVRDAPIWRGLVCDRSPTSVQIAISDFPEPSGDRPTFRLDASFDEIARQRQLDALTRAGAARGDRLAELSHVLLGDRTPEFRSDLSTQDTQHSNRLNDSQREAVRLGMSARHVAVIHGPPGTGKTTTVVELIRQAIRGGEKVLACAPSNLAVDNLFERLLAAGERTVRLGHPARVLPQLRANTLDCLVEEHPDVRLARKLIREARLLRDQAGKYTRAKPEPGGRRGLRDEAKSLFADARRLEAQAVEQILNQADVLCATLTGLDSEVLGQRRFDLVVIDEACQAVEPACWIPLLRGERVVLAGDHCQLPPTIVSPEAVRESFGVSLLERLVDQYGPQITRRLEVQYRMHQSIMAFSSAEFYDNGLVADESVAGHLLRDAIGVADDALTATPLEFTDTAGAGYDEEQDADGASRFNREEASWVVRKLHTLREAGVVAANIAVVAPYAAQVRLLRELIDADETLEGVEVDSVDGFQGREKDAIIISLVRSNSSGEIGFLADTRRMNVALTRARRKLIVIGDSATLAHHAFYQRFLDHVELAGAYRTVWDDGNDV